MRSQRERLLDFLGAIEEIEEYAGLAHDAYVRNKLIQGWMILHLQRIGEAAAELGRKHLLDNVSVNDVLSIIGNYDLCRNQSI